MTLPFFYSEDISPEAKQYVLNEDTSRHIIQVLRMKKGEMLHLTNGKGYLFLTELSDDNKKKTIVKINNTIYKEPSTKKFWIAISLIKNVARFEWFLEKSVEIGITGIIPLICKRTEKQNIKIDRINNIMVSAMLQSRQCWLPTFEDPLMFGKVISRQGENKFIAHCEDVEIKNSLRSFLPLNDALILIGPEGDFTQEEINLAIQQGFKAVSLGNTRLRTETAGLVAITLLNAH